MECFLLTETHALEQKLITFFYKELENKDVQF
jgi:hypothetical protein